MRVETRDRALQFTREDDERTIRERETALVALEMERDGTQGGVTVEWLEPDERLQLVAAKEHRRESTGNRLPRGPPPQERETLVEHVVAGHGRSVLTRQDTTHDLSRRFMVGVSSVKERHQDGRVEDERHAASP